MKRKLLLAALCVVGGFGYLKAADLPTSGSGEFFIKNVGTGTFLKGDAYYGTKAVVWNDPYAVTLTYVSEGVYTIMSQQNNGGENQYFGSTEDFYVDQGASNMTFTEVDADNHYYTIANATGNLYATQVTEDGAILYKVMAGDVTTDYAKWQIVSRAELEAALDDASDSNPVDATFFIKDAGIDVKSVNAGSWSTTNVDLGGGGNAGHSAESWKKASFSMSQTVTGLPNGKYRATCYGYYRWNNGSTNDNAAAVSGHASGDEVLNAVFFAGTKETPLQSIAGDADATAFCQTMEWANNTPNNQWQAAACFTQGFYLNTIEDIVVTDGSLTIGVKKTTQAGTDWAVFDEFKLYYFGEDLSIYVDAYNEALIAAQAVDQDAPMLGTALSALQTAISNYGSVDTSDKDALLEATSALNTATADANTSIAAYAVAASAIADAKALQTAHNFVTTDAATTFAEAIEAIETPYNANTLSNAEATAAGTTLGVVNVGWHAAATNTPASNYMISAWPNSLTVNDWSVEGVTDGSDFLVPFFQDWIADANSLATKTWTGTLTGLDNGLYSVSAWVRVRAKNGTAATDATGISMNVNGGGEGDYAAVDVTEGTQVGETQFQLATYTAQNLVKDGTLNVNFVVADGNNISWLSFKNVKYTKVRDLTPEEEAVAPTAIALYNGETEVTEPIALDATTNTTTLTATLTPAEATEGNLAWTSSDETVATVADGVVTGVAPGTATITVTSTLDAEVSATATVTVSYPESEYATSSYVNDGATRTVVTLGENLFKNGSFGYPNAVYGWKTVGYTTDAVTNNFTINATGGANDGAYITTNGGGTGSEKTLRKSIAVEVGKTYYFSVYTSGKAPSSNNLQYNALFAMSNATTESAKLKEFEWPQGAGNTTTEWSKTEYIFTATTPYVGVRMGWNENSNFDEFVLAEVISQTTEGNVDYATAAIPTANIGTGAFQYSQTAINAANALVQGTATVAEVEAAYEALQTLNAPAANKVYNVINITSGYAYNGNALTFLSASDADLTGNTTNMKWYATPGSIYPQGVTFTAVEGVTNGYKMSYTRADGSVVYVATGSSSGLGSNTAQIRPTTDANKALTVVVTYTGDNKWSLLNTEDNHSIGATSDNGFYTNGGANKDVQIQEAVNNEVSLSITAANKYGTLILPFEATVPAGVTAYSVEEVSGSTLTLNDVESFAANTPYIVYAEVGATETLAGLGAAYTDATYTSGLLTGVYTATSEIPDDSYVLASINNKVAFYQVDNTDKPTVGANRAYLTAPATGGGESPAKARAFYFDDDTATAIATISALTSGEVEAIYTIGGARVNSLQKGINIVKMKNGETKKIIVK